MKNAITTKARAGAVESDSGCARPSARLVARDGSIIGHLAFLDREPMGPDVVLESVYRIFTARAAVEIELSRALLRLRTLAHPVPVTA